MQDNTSQTKTSKPLNACDEIVQQILREREEYRTGYTSLSDKVSLNMYREIQDIKTHQNRGFLTELKKGQADEREAYDIITPMVDTNIDNIDVDTENFDLYTPSETHYFPELVARSLLNNYLVRTNKGEKINEDVAVYCDDGNLIVRADPKDGELYRPVHPLNISLTDITARTLEDTDVIEEQIMNQTKLLEMEEWQDLDRVITECNLSPVLDIPYYQVFYRYGEISDYLYYRIKKELYDETYKENEEDKKKFRQRLVVMVQRNSKDKGAKYKYGSTDESTGGHSNTIESKGIVVFCEDLKPVEIKINEKVKIKRYKPYESAHFGEYKGCFWREGLRAKGKPYQNNANRIGNQLRRLLKHLKLLYHTTDKNMVGYNILSNVVDGQMIVSKDLNVLNNQFPNLQFLVEEWNRNIEECRRALKSYEVATGENTPSTASATAVATQNQAIGRHFSRKKEKLGLFYSAVYARWVIPELLGTTKDEEKIEIMGDPSYLEEYIDYKAEKQMFEIIKQTALAGEIFSGENYEMTKEIIKESFYKKKKMFEENNGLFDDVTLFLTLNVTGEMFNKQNKITNGIALLQFETDPAERQEMLNDIKRALGFKVRLRSKQPVMAQQPQGQQPNNLPQAEPSMAGPEKV